MRTFPASALFITVGLGIVSRIVVTGFVLFDKYLGDALYTAAIFWVLLLMWPRQAHWRVAAWSFGVSLAVECFQMTGWPQQMRESSSALLRIVSIVLGTEFSLRDIVAYAIGAMSCIAASSLRRHRVSQ